MKLCRSVCKSAIEQDFAACPCDGDSSCATQFTDNCKSDAFFGANAGNCTTHAGKLFSSNELGTGYYVGIALGAFALLFTCRLTTWMPSLTTWASTRRRPLTRTASASTRSPRKR